MGNYGNTLDRWYRRAAVVVWPRDRAFAARGEAGSRWALEELRGRIAAGDMASARAAAESLAPFWKSTARQTGLLGVALDVAAGLDVAGTAAMLLEPFRVEMLTHEHATELAAVAGRYGEEWTRVLIGGWFRSPETGREEWASGLPRLCVELHAAGAPDVVGLLTVGTWRWIDDQFRAATTATRSEYRRRWLEQLSSPLVGLFDAADGTLRDEMMATLRGYPDTVLECLMPALRSARPGSRAAFGGVVRDCSQRLDAIIAGPPRAEDDWSIAWTGCACDLCDQLGTFLRSGSRRTHEWPLAKDGRRQSHEDRLSRAAGAAPHPAAGASLHPGADQDRRALHAREGRQSTGRGRPDVADGDVGRHAGAGVSNGGVPPRSLISSGLARNIRDSAYKRLHSRSSAATARVYRRRACSA